MFTIFLYLCIQDDVGASEISKRSFERYREDVYELIVDSSCEVSERAELIAYVMLFEGPLAIQKLYPLLQRSEPVMVKNAILRYWSCCLQESDEELLYSIFNDLPDESLFLCIKNLISLSKNGDSYIRIFEAASKRDINLAVKALQYMPLIEDYASFPNFLSTLLFSDNDLIRKGAQSKLLQYFHGEEIFRFYLISTASGFPREEWLSLLARLDYYDANQEALEWLLGEKSSQRSPNLCKAVAKSLVGKDVLINKLDDVELSNHIDDYLKFEMMSSVDFEYLIHNFDRAPLFWQKQALEHLDKKNKSIAFDIWENVSADQSLRNQACQSLMAIGENWKVIFRSCKDVEEASIALRVAFENGVLIEDLLEEARSHDDKKRLIFELHCLLAASSHESHNLLAVNFLEELFLQTQSKNQNLFTLKNVSEIRVEIPEIYSLVTAFSRNPQLISYDSKLRIKEKAPWFLREELTPDGACIIVALFPYLVERFPATSEDCLSRALEILQLYQRWHAYSLALAARYFCGLEIGGKALKQLISQPNLLEFEFQIREALSPEGREWRVLEKGLKHLKIFSDAVVEQNPSLLELLLNDSTSSSILCTASEYLMTLESNQNYDVFDLSFQLAKKAVDSSPFSLKSHNQLARARHHIDISTQEHQVFEARLNRLKTLFHDE